MRCNPGGLFFVHQRQGYDPDDDAGDQVFNEGIESVFFAQHGLDDLWLELVFTHVVVDIKRLIIGKEKEFYSFYIFNQ